MLKLKKIDLHVHTILYPDIALPRPRGSNFVDPEGLLKMYDDWGIERGVILPRFCNEGKYAPNSNEEACIISRRYPDRFFWFMDLSPSMGENGETTDFDRIVSHYKNLGAKGVGEMTFNRPFDDPVVQNILKAAANADLPVLIHIAHQIGGCYGVYDELGLPRLEAMLKKYPNLHIFGHSQCFWSQLGTNVTEENRMRYPQGPVEEGRLFELLRTYPNLYCDLSATSGSSAMLRDEDNALRFLEEFQDRCMFGTDICAPYNTFPLGGWLDKMNAEGKLSDEIYYKVCRGNVIRELRLPIKDDIAF